MEPVFESTPLDLQPAVRPGVDGERGRIGVGFTERLYPAPGKKMAHATFEKLAVQRVDDVSRSGCQILLEHTPYPAIGSVRMAYECRSDLPRIGFSSSNSNRCAGRRPPIAG